MCTDEKGLTKKQFIFSIAAISVKTIRSIGFNIVMLLIGFVIGFGTMHTIQHIAWSRNQNYECVRDLEEHLKQQRELDDKIDSEITELKLSILKKKIENGN